MAAGTDVPLNIAEGHQLPRSPLLVRVSQRLASPNLPYMKVLGYLFSMHTTRGCSLTDGHSTYSLQHHSWAPCQPSFIKGAICFQNPRHAVHKGEGRELCQTFIHSLMTAEH